jgi:hypothetical protein
MNVIFREPDVHVMLPRQLLRSCDCGVVRRTDELCAPWHDADLMFDAFSETSTSPSRGLMMMDCKNDPQALTEQIGFRRAAGILTLDDIIQFFTSQQNETQHRM